MESSRNKFYSVQEKDLNSSNSYCTQRPDLTTPRKLTKMTGCLEIIVGEDCSQSKSSQNNQCNSHSSDEFIRPGSGIMGYVPTRTDSSLSRRLNTPTKQISLQAVRRKEGSAELFVDHVDWQCLGLKSNNRKIWELGINNVGVGPSKTIEHKEIFQLESVDDTSQQSTQLSLLEPRVSEKKKSSQKEQFLAVCSMEGNKEKEMSSEDKTQDDKNGSEDEDSDDSDDDSDSSDEEEEKLKAPNELLMEFVDCLMRTDFQIASKLCKMILLYEPENPEAMKLQPLIEEKLALDAEAEKEAAAESDDDDSGSSEDDDEDDEDDDDSTEDSSDNDSSSSDDEDDDEDDDGEGDSPSNNTSNNNNMLFGLNPRSSHH